MDYLYKNKYIKNKTEARLYKQDMLWEGRDNGHCQK